MKYFVERAVGVTYYFVLDERRPAFPFGVCGPFAKRREAKKAAAKLRACFPSHNLGVHAGWFADRVPSGLLIEARADARAKLKSALCLRAASQGTAADRSRKEVR
ncbi:hypothetical protein [Ectopseudomonas toyotomiensis]|uniref:hypothetical protein n=1 Tax=Ectopseudomonas toyotomiensis TaxID=554344 RepID=UPI003D135C58